MPGVQSPSSESKEQSEELLKLTAAAGPIHIPVSGSRVPPSGMPTRIPAAFASLACLGLNTGLLWYLFGLD